MSSSLPENFPPVLADSPTLVEAFIAGKLTPKLIRDTEESNIALQTGEVSLKFMDTIWGMPFYMAYTAPTEESSSIAFERHFNPKLQYDSDYFKTVNAMIKCVENNIDTAVTQE